MFTVAVAVVAIPARSLRKFDRQECVDGAKRIEDPRVFGGAQTESNQRQRVGADDVISALAILPGRTVLDWHESLCRRSRAIGVGRRDAHVIAFDSELLGEITSAGVYPALDIGVPCVGGVAHDLSLLRMTGEVGDVRSRKQSGNFCRESKWGIAGVFFPAILLRHGTVSNDEAGGIADHGPPAVEFAQRLGCLAAHKIDEQNGEGGFVHLDAAPIGPAVEPQILRPVSLGLLRGFEVSQHADGVICRARSQQCARTLDQIARPDQVIPAEIFVAFVESPGNREASDDASEKILGLVSAQDSCRGAIQIVLAQGGVEFEELGLPVTPLRDVVLADFVVILKESRAGLLAGLSPDPTESESEDELAVAGSEVDLASEGDVAVFRARVFPLHLEVLGKILPAVGSADKADGHLFPGSRRRQTQGDPIVLGEEHRIALVIANPSRIAIAEIREVRREQSKQTVVGQLPNDRLQTDFLQDHIAVGIAQNLFVYAVSTRVAAVDHLIRRNTGFDRTVFKGAIPLFFGEEIAAVGDDETHVTSAGLIYAGKIDFVQDAVT